eukprot:jgi/Mesen1/9960/ME000716S09337
MSFKVTETHSSLLEVRGANNRKRRSGSDSGSGNRQRICPRHLSLATFKCLAPTQPPFTLRTCGAGAGKEQRRHHHHRSSGMASLVPARSLERVPGVIRASGAPLTSEAGLGPARASPGRCSPSTAGGQHLAGRGSRQLRRGPIRLTKLHMAGLLGASCHSSLWQHVRQQEQQQQELGVLLLLLLLQLMWREQVQTGTCRAAGAGSNEQALAQPSGPAPPQKKAGPPWAPPGRFQRDDSGGYLAEPDEPGFASDASSDASSSYSSDFSESSQQPQQFWSRPSGTIGTAVGGGSDSDSDDLLSPKAGDGAAGSIGTTSAGAVRELNGNFFEAARSVAELNNGVLPSLLLFAALGATLLLVDAYIWRVIRRPLAAFFLTLPFLLSTALTYYAGALCIPLLRSLKMGQIVRAEGPGAHLTKAGTPTMGGLFFLPVGLIVAILAIGFPAQELRAVALATLAFGLVGLLDDALGLVKRHNYGLPGWIKFLLQMVVGFAFATWLSGAALPSPYSILYSPLTAFTFTAMSNGVNLTDGVDGLAAGTAAIAFVGMAIASMPIFPWACLGFLAHNRHKASVFMGDTGSLALGGGLAAMAACTGMFVPLFIASAWFVLETVSVMAQVGYFKITKKMFGEGRRLFKMAPFHHHLELSGLSEPKVVALAYICTLVFSAAAAYVGLISA